MNGAEVLGDEAIWRLALSIRKRRLLYWLREIKSANEKLEETMAARRRRARLIRLARRHGFKHCLERLRYPGMVVETVGGKPVIEFDSIVRSYTKHNLLCRIEDLRKARREFQDESPDLLVGNIRGLLENGEWLEDSPPRVRFTVDGVELDNVWIGDLEVTLSLVDFDVRVSNRSIDADSKEGFPHPHVNTIGMICWSEHEETARVYHAAGDFLPLRDLIENLLRTYNDASPYITLETWVDGPRETCRECGERCNSDDLAFSHSCGESLCEFCRRYCNQCEDYIREQDYDTDLDACNSCVERDSRSCDVCGDQVWKRDLEEIEIETDGETQTVSACKSCRDDRRKEENDEDNSDSPRLLASAMDGSPNAVRSFLDGSARSRKGRAGHRGFHSGAAGRKPNDGAVGYGLVGGKAA